MEEGCEAECIHEVKHREEAVGGEEPGRVVAPSRRTVLPPFLEKILGRKT